MALRKSLNDKIWQDIYKLDSKKQRITGMASASTRADLQILGHKNRRSFDQEESVGAKVLYYHHFLCIGSEGEGRPTILHYSNTASNAFRQVFDTFSFGSGSALGQLGIVSELTLPHKDFIQSESELQEKGAEVERVVWPDELKRYPVEQVMRNFTNTFVCTSEISIVEKIYQDSFCLIQTGHAYIYSC